MAPTTESQQGMTTGQGFLKFSGANRNSLRTRFHSLVTAQKSPEKRRHPIFLVSSKFDDRFDHAIHSKNVRSGIPI